MKKNKDVYMVHVTPGLMWQKDKPYRKQKNINQHVSFMKKMYKNNKISYATASADGKNNFYVIKEFTNQAELEIKLSENPLIKNKILSFKIINSTLHMKEHDH